MMNPKKASELVLVFDEELMFGFQGLRADKDKRSLLYEGVSSETRDYDWFYEVLKRSYWMPRGTVENNEHYKQIIPYVVLRCNGKVFSYCRAGSEDRLSGLISIGIGGHLNLRDYQGVLTQVPPNGAKREFWEEVYLEDGLTSDHMLLDSSFSNKPYLLYDPKDAVGQVHFGVVYIIHISESVADKLRMREEGVNVEWRSIDELRDLDDQLEGWSRLVVSECL